MFVLQEPGGGDVPYSERPGREEWGVPVAGERRSDGGALLRTRVCTQNYHIFVDIFVISVCMEVLFDTWVCLHIMNHA